LLTRHPSCAAQRRKRARDIIWRAASATQFFWGFIYGHLENVAVLENKRLRILPIKIPPKNLGGIFMGRSTFGGVILWATLYVVTRGGGKHFGHPRATKRVLSRCITHSLHILDAKNNRDGILKHKCPKGVDGRQSLLAIGGLNARFTSHFKRN
jgi:hypothetical protein